MRALRRIASATVLAGSLAILPATATAQTTPDSYTYRVSGAEVYASSTVGRFVGTASGGGTTGTWYAEVVHDRLGTNAAIRGGSLSMVLSNPAPAYTVAGRFVPCPDCYITRTNAGANCTNQVYTVHGELADVTVSEEGSFDVTLTHYRRSVLGRCVTYSATVNGTVTLGPDLG
jgi:hypothetical protein